MDELRNAIILLFRYVSAEAVINGQVKWDELSQELLQELYYVGEPFSDEAENGRRIQYLIDEVKLELDEDDERILRKPDRDSVDLFDLVNLFSRLVLVNRHEEAVCRFQYLGPWREMTKKLDGSVFVAAKYANIDYKHGKTRTTFTWKTVVGHDNDQLNKILNEGISDNHFHLYASVHYFDLSWLNLMNRVNDPVITRKVEELNSAKREVSTAHKYNRTEKNLSLLHLQAALIRVYLFSELTDRPICLGDYRAHWDWLLGYVCEREPVSETLSGLVEEKVVRDAQDDLYDGLQAVSQDGLRDDLCMGQDSQDDPYTELRVRCPMFFWILRSTLPQGAEYGTEKEIFEALRRSEELSLQECRWMFRRDGGSYYDGEWKRQTDDCMDSLLKSTRLQDERDALQRCINGFLHMGNHDNKDYMMNAAGSWYADDESDAVMIGERWLLYQMFRRKYNVKRKGWDSDTKNDIGRESWNHGRKNNSVSRGKEDRYLYQLFYAYLVIKEAFRIELLQNNEREGFLNFRVYQGRKTWFLPEYTAGELSRIAVDSVFRYQTIKSLEIRIKPERTCGEDAERIRRFEKSIGKGRPYYFVFHFSKRRDTTVEMHEGFGHMFYRHYDLRQEIRRQAEALIMLRKTNPELAQRVRGIDTCSNEDGCRPEVFATVYRVLRNHSCYRGLSQKPEVPQLRMTFHVGEVFQDIADGLRAIDEAILFLNMDSGDRLGHCTVLGIDPREWYRQANYRINIRCQDYLDNVTWLYHMLIRYHVSGAEALLEYLQSEYQLYFSQIFGKAIEKGYVEKVTRKACAEDERFGKISEGETIPFETNIHVYYYSWMLRGDHPGLYSEGYYKRENNVKSLWEDYSINHTFPKEKRIRYILPAGILNHFYHYSSEVKIRGSKTKQITIPDTMVEGICIIQKELQKEIAHREIGIETNPSSNVLISGMKSYDEHPIVHFYNKGLTADPEKLKECAQLNVSINTDDQGVFSTELSNEYALMVSALGEIKDDDGNFIYRKSDIYDWVKDIQEMGNRQAFTEK